MERIEIEKIFVDLNVPDPDQDPENRLFVQIDPEKCTGCAHCMDNCPTSAIYGETGLAHRIMHPEPCLHCGVCLLNCPEGAIYEKVSWLTEVEQKLADPDTVCIAMPAPSIRYTLGEAFDLEPGRNIVERMYSALNQLGFEHCWDTEFAADVTIWEEGSEFLQRLEDGGPFPQFSTCCPAWQRYVETFYPELLGYCATAKSPIAINGRLAKTYGATSYHYNPKNLYTVALMPCIAKKYEALRPELRRNGLRDIDAVLTARELAWLLRKKGIDPNNMVHGLADTLMGESAAGTLFGIGGGVVETLCRYVYEKLAGEKSGLLALRKSKFADGIFECELKINGKSLKMATVQGGSNFAKICNEVLKGRSPYHFIEFMACPGGCINGGGQPLLRSLLKRRFHQDTGFINVAVFGR